MRSLWLFTLVGGLSQLPFLAAAVDFPAWWQQRGVLKLNGNQPVAADDYAAVNQGQLKNVAVAAYEEMNARLTVPFGGVNGAGPEVTALVRGWLEMDSAGHILLDGAGQRIPKVTGATDDFAVVNLGQLKAVARVFYDRITPTEYRHYPWTGSSHPPDDFALANIGQVKNVFSFGLDHTRDRDGDGIDDLAEINGGSDPLNGDTDGDGVSDSAEAGGGGDPLRKDNPSVQLTAYGYVTP